LEDILEKPHVVGIGQQPKIPDFKGVRAAKQRKSALVIQAGNRDGERFETDPAVNSVKDDAPATR
jgi:hypothetical protein